MNIDSLASDSDYPEESARGFQENGVQDFANWRKLASLIIHQYANLQLLMVGVGIAVYRYV